jgi:hypothetical protein
MPPAAPTLDRRRALAELVRERDAGRVSGRLVGRAIVGLLLLALLALLGLWLGGGFSGVPPEVREIRQMVDGQIEQLRQAGRNELPLEAAAGGFDAVRERVRDLPPALQRQAGRELGRLYAARERAELDAFFNLPPERRPAELDRRIRAEEERRKAREAERTRRETQPPQQAAVQGGGRATAAGGPPAAVPRGQSTTEEARNARRKSRIDNSSPQERARRTEYRRAMDDRRRQLGLPTGGR